MKAALLLAGLLVLEARGSLLLNDNGTFTYWPDDGFSGEAPMSVEQLVDLQLQHEKIDRLLRSLAQREEQILRIRYGFHDGIARTLAETGEHFGITRERVRQIESRALVKLRHALELHTFRNSTAA